MSISPSASFTDMHDEGCRLTAEYNIRSVGPYPAHGGVWLCVQNKGNGNTVAVDLSDEDAKRLGEFLIGHQKIAPSSIFGELETCKKGKP